MTESPFTTGQPAGRRRRFIASAAAGALLTVGIGSTAYAVLAQEPAPPRIATAPTEAPATASAQASPSTPSTPKAGATETAKRAPAQPLVLPDSRPVQISIPSLGVRSELIDLGLNPDRTMEVPRDPDDVGWFDQSVTPGELGPAVLAGHVTWQRKPAVFFELAALRTGQRVEVKRADGSTAVFAVTDVQQHPKDRFPTKAVYGAIDHAGLRLITCAGTYDDSNARYLDNVVVFAKLVGSRPAKA